ncbi:MAG: hypothetical protein ACI8X5_002889 [Planctomycetota bacterium]|jgi:hypothetical protein
MIRRLSTVALCTLTLTPYVQSAGEPAARPNILLITLDNMAPFGSEIRAPSIDSLARKVTLVDSVRPKWNKESTTLFTHTLQ